METVNPFADRALERFANARISLDVLSWPGQGVMPPTSKTLVWPGFEDGLSLRVILASPPKELPIKLHVPQGEADQLLGLWEEWKQKRVGFAAPFHLAILDRRQAFITYFKGEKSFATLFATTPKLVDTYALYFDSLWNADHVVTFPEVTAAANRTEGNALLTSAKDYWDGLIQEFSAHPERLRAVRPRLFEELVAELLSRDGLQVELTPTTRDGGRDILAYLPRKFGNLLCYVECKRYAADKPVSVQIVRQLYGVVEEKKASAGLIVTTSRFTGPARDFEERISNRMSLRDFQSLAEWVRSHAPHD
jgi:hypothetical protein